jgi:rubrerythrin
VSEITLRIEGRYRRETTDAGRLRTTLHVEEVAALAYATAAERVLEGEERALAERFAAHEREHAGALMTMILALTLEVRRHAVQKDVDNLMPGFEALGRREMLAALLELETAALAGQQALARPLANLDALRTVAMVMAGGAQHLVVLRDLLDERPLTNVFENGR